MLQSLWSPYDLKRELGDATKKSRLPRSSFGLERDLGDGIGSYA